MNTKATGSGNIASKNIASQMSLFGLGARPEHEHNYFFALSPDADVRARISRAADELEAMHSFNGGWVASERYHMTLHHLGQFPDVRADLVARALTAAGKIHARPFDITLDQFMCFESKTGRYPCVLTPGNEQPALQNFWQLLKNNLFAVRLGEHLTNNFKPHTTLLYNRQPIRETQAIAPIDWHVTDFVLIESLVGKSEHRELGRWPLSA